jgi:hypothetical protein
MSPRRKPSVFEVNYLDPFSGGVEVLRLNARNASRYAEYENDLKKAKQLRSSAPLRKWERRTFEDLRKQRWIFDTDLDNILAQEEELTDEEQVMLENPIDSP